MVSSSNTLHSRLLLSGEFPEDHAVRPACVTVPLSWLYGAGVFVHKFARSVHGAYRPSTPVISVGNITVGGTGKTPVVIALLGWLMENYPRLAAPNAVAVLSRGYGREDKSLVTVEPDMDYLRTGDEPLLIKRALPQAAVVVHANRARAALFAVETLGAKLLILDDGFQHQALARDLDLVVLDPFSPFGNGYLLPAGPLRESRQALVRADGIAIIGEDSALRQFAAERFGKPVIQFVPELTLPKELSTDLSTPVWLLTSIARPSRLLNQLINMKINIIGHSVFRDHHRFTDRDLRQSSDEAKRSGARIVLATQKDKVRISSWVSELPLSVVEYRLKMRTPEILLNLVEPIVGRAVAK